MWQKRRQQWYGRPAALFFADNPCSFNTIGGVTGTQRVCESRTREQATDKRWGRAKRWSKPPRKTIRDTKGYKGVLCRKWGVC